MTKEWVLLDCVLVLVLWLLGDCFEECFSLVLFILVVDFIFVNKSLTCHGFNLQLWFLNANALVKINLYDLSLECYQIYQAFSIAPCYVWCFLENILIHCSISTWHIFLFVLFLISNPKRFVWISLNLLCNGFLPLIGCAISSPPSIHHFPWPLCEVLHIYLCYLICLIFILHSLYFYLCFTKSNCIIDGILTNYVYDGHAMKA